MTEFEELCDVAFHGERVASRRLALRTGVTEEAALRSTLARAAGATGLAALCEQRRARKAVQEARFAMRAAEKARANAQRASRHDGVLTPWRGWFDGSAHPNPGRCGIGALIIGPDGERIALSRAAGYGNSSEAEYMALIAALEAARDAGAHGLTLYGDSQVVINDMGGDDAAAASSLRELRARARSLADALGGVTLRWIPRHKNAEADGLSQRAVAAWADDQPPAL